MDHPSKRMPPVDLTEPQKWSLWMFCYITKTSITNVIRDSMMLLSEITHTAETVSLHNIYDVPFQIYVLFEGCLGQFIHKLHEQIHSMKSMRIADRMLEDSENVLTDPDHLSSFGVHSGLVSSMQVKNTGPENNIFQKYIRCFMDSMASQYEFYIYDKINPDIFWVEFRDFNAYPGELVERHSRVSSHLKMNVRRTQPVVLFQIITRICNPCVYCS